MRCLPLLCLIALPLTAAAQISNASSVILGTRLSIPSRALNETREVIVATPPGYSQPGSRFPVLFVLDGSENLLTTVSASRALASAGRMPPAIVVAVVNTNRSRDFTPSLVATKELPPEVPATGADPFLQFLSTELVPLIDSKYRTYPMRVIIGHSLGGLLAMHALAVKPALFRGYLTLEPSLWWDDRHPAKAVLDSLRAHRESIGRLVDVEGTSDEGWKPDWDALTKSAPAHFRASFVHIANESHENLPYLGIYAGLAKLFDDYLPLMRHDRSYANVDSLRQQYSVISRDFGYPVKPPLGSLLTIANNEANQRRFAQARQALAVADSLYPGSPSSQQFRAGIAEVEKDAAASRLGPPTSALEFRPTTAAEAASLIGDWDVLMRVEPGTPFKGTASFFTKGDSLMIRFTAHGVAIDGGDLSEPPSPVRVVGDSVYWERENAGGGHAVTAAKITAPDRMKGEETIAGGHKLPPGFTPPRAFVELTRRPRS